MFEQARLANEYPPRLKTFDAKGRRSDTVEFHPAYHRFMAESIAAGLHASTWQRRRDAGAGAGRGGARRALLHGGAGREWTHVPGHHDAGRGRGASAASRRWLEMLMPKLAVAALRPDASGRGGRRSGITLGMGMTEKQGGTDVRANTTRAEPDGDGVPHHRPQMVHVGADVGRLPGAGAGAGRADLFLPAALSRRTARVNALHFQRLKDKLGNRSNASSEVEFDDAYALRVGEEGRGIRTILQMVQLTRLDCAISSAGMMRAALAQALHHCRHRSVFQQAVSPISR